MNCLYLCLVAAALTSPADTPLASTPSSDLDQFQGEWKAVSIINDEGKPTPAGELEQTKLIVKGDRFTLKANDSTISGRFSINSAVSPKTIDVLLDATDGPPTTKLLGIYRIDGDTRKSCFALPDRPRPAQFPDSPKGFLQFEWKRAAKEPSARK
jgi:uncharacterized protein (TIGR03067 family)